MKRVLILLVVLIACSSSTANEQATNLEEQWIKVQVSEHGPCKLFAIYKSNSDRPTVYWSVCESNVYNSSITSYNGY